MKSGRFKVIYNKHIVEVYEFEEPVCFGYEHISKSKSTDVSPTDEQQSENRSKSAIRARNNIRRLAIANFSNNDKFLTLTFENGSVPDITDIVICNKAFKKFIMRLRYRLKKSVKYIAVVEFQDKNNRGAIHYHLLIDIPFIPHDELTRLWGNGFVWIKDIAKVDNIGAYLVKYMTKDNFDERLKGHKSYQTSRNLDRPFEIRGAEAELLIERMKLSEMRPVYIDGYMSKHNGGVIYREYNLMREKE